MSKLSVCECRYIPFMEFFFSHKKRRMWMLVHSASDNSGEEAKSKQSAKVYVVVSCLFVLSESPMQSFKIIDTLAATRRIKSNNGNRSVRKKRLNRYLYLAFIPLLRAHFCIKVLIFPTNSTEKDFYFE